MDENQSVPFLPANWRIKCRQCRLSAQHINSETVMITCNTSDARQTRPTNGQIYTRCAAHGLQSTSKKIPKYLSCSGSTSELCRMLLHATYLCSHLFGVLGTGWRSNSARNLKDIAFPSDILGHPVELCITLGESQDPYRCRCENSGAGAGSACSCHSGDNCWSIRVAHGITGDPIT